MPVSAALLTLVADAPVVDELIDQKLFLQRREVEHHTSLLHRLLGPFPVLGDPLHGAP